MWNHFEKWQIQWIVCLFPQNTYIIVGIVLIKKKKQLSMRGSMSSELLLVKWKMTFDDIFTIIVESTIEPCP